MLGLTDPELWHIHCSLHVSAQRCSDTWLQDNKTQHDEKSAIVGTWKKLKLMYWFILHEYCFDTRTNIGIDTIEIWISPPILKGGYLLWQVGIVRGKKKMEIIETGQNRNYERNLMTCAIVVFKATGSEKMIMEKRWSVHQQHPLAE